MSIAKKFAAVVIVLVIIGGILGVIFSSSSTDTETPIAPPIDPPIDSPIIILTPKTCNEVITHTCLTDLWNQEPNKCSTDITKYNDYHKWLTENIPYNTIASEIQFIKTSPDEESTLACHNYINPVHPPNPKFEHSNIPVLDKREYLSSQLSST